MKDTQMPQVKKDGIVFWPIPDVTDVQIAFGAEESDYFSRRAIPVIPGKFKNEANRLFFSGGELPEFGDDVDKVQAVRWLRSRLSSFAPSHEAKEATVAYALWVWSPDASEVRAASSVGANHDN